MSIDLISFPLCIIIILQVLLPFLHILQFAVGEYSVHLQAVRLNNKRSKHKMKLCDLEVLTLNVLSTKPSAYTCMFFLKFINKPCLFHKVCYNFRKLE